ncbi:bifunctional 2',3'-cyclic-nucleotide 2'-phosphodiesterase/3'-nucleotidase [Neobacillus drentensis]|nr:bifunctional 2',3'-cyclic-nucleotide 2'-phosphodiesterase/3'-nucleotidase [Neobacillus drentensis]
MKRRMLNTSLATMLALTTVPLNIFPQAVKAEGNTESTVKLRFLETTDLHSNVMDYDYYQDKPTIEFGLDRTAKLITQARTEKINPNVETSPTYEKNSMLFDAGDLLQGNPFADYVAKVKKLGATEQHPVFKAMDILNYDAGIAGNHEFNYGLDFLNNALEEVPYNFVNANIYDATTGKNYFNPYKIIDKKVVDEAGVEQTIRVGVIGFAPPQIMQWDKDNLQGKVTVKGIVETANEFIPKMKAEGADIIVAIAHSGCDVAAPNAADAENAVYSLSQVQGIDALLFGHAHVNFPGDATFNGKTGIDNTKGHINNVPAMEAGFWGNNLGVMDLDLQKVDGKWQVTNSLAALRSIFKTNADKTKTSLVDGPDQRIVDAVKETHEGTLGYVRGKIGETEAPMFSYFSRVMDDPTIQIVNNAQTEYVKKYIKANKPELENVPIISAGAPFKAGRQGTGDYTNITKGDLSIKSANDLYLYNNTLKAVELTGAEVKEWLEMSASQFKRIDPNDSNAQELIDYGFQPFNFDVIDGLKYQIDVTQPARYDYNTGDVIKEDAHRIITFTDMNGNEINPEQKFIVVTNNYRASGGGNFPGTKGGQAKLVVDSPDENRQVLMDYISEHKIVNPTADNNWKIAPVGGVAKNLVFRSSPDAIPFTAQTPNVKSVGTENVNGVTWQQYQLDQNVHVQLLGINDFHGQLDYSTTVSNRAVGGIEYLAAYLKQREATNPANTLMLQAGDLVGASRPVSALLQDEPTIRFMNEIGMDIGTIGNHEFDEGVAEMKRLIYGGAHPKTEAKYGAFEGANFDYIVANVEDEKTGELILPPYAIKEVDGVKIGFIGVVTTETPTIVTASGVAGVKFTDEVEAVNKYTAVLKEKGVKSIVVLAHDPGTSASNGDNPTGKVVDMAKAIDDEVDVIYGAHDHKYLNSTVDGKLLVQSYSYGTAFSDVDLTIDPVTKDIVTKKAEVASTFKDSITPDAKIKAELDKYQADIAPQTSEVVGVTTAPISRAQNKSGEAPMGNLIADSMRAKTGTQFAFMNIGGVRDEIKKAGDVTWGDLFAVQPFGNDVVSLKITGDQVRTLINQQFQADRYRIMQISGLSYTWSDKLPLGQKVVDIFLPDGSKIDPVAEYSVSVNNFMADGGDGFTILKEGKERTTWTTDLEALVDYVNTFKGQSPITAEIEGRIKQEEVTLTAPTVAEVNDQSKKVTGTAVAGTKVKVKAKGTVIGLGTAAEDGSYTVDIPVQKAGTELIVTSIDAALNVSYEARVRVIDVTAPLAPVVNDVNDQSKTVTGKAEAGALVEVKANGTLVGSATASNDGDFTVEIEVQKAGTELVITATDAAKNVSASTTVKVIDITDPTAPAFDPITNMSTEIKGHGAEPGTHVYITNGFNLKVHLTADENGNFSVPLMAPLKEGTQLFAFSVDLSFNLSPIGYTFVLDVIAPDKAVVNDVSNKDKVVTGTAEVGSTVTVSSNKTLGTAKTGADGKFSVSLPAAQAAKTVLTIVVSDPSGNKSETTIKVSDKIAPVVGGVVNNGIYNKNVTVTFNEGTATLDGKSFKAGIVATEGVHTLVVTDEAGNKTTVKFTIDKKAPVVTGVSNNGLYKKDVIIYFNEGKALLNGNAVATKTVVKIDAIYTLVVTDAAGNKTTVKFTIDKKAPSTPTVDKITVKSTKVTGKAEAYSTVVVKVSGKVIGSRTADKYGKFSITIAKQKAGKVVEVVAIDKAGNVSKTAKVTVK